MKRRIIFQIFILTLFCTCLICSCSRSEVISTQVITSTIDSLGQENHTPQATIGFTTTDISEQVQPVQRMVEFLIQEDLVDKCSECLSNDLTRYFYIQDGVSGFSIYDAVADTVVTYDPIAEGLGLNMFEFQSWSSSGDSFLLSTDFEKENAHYDPNSTMLIYHLEEDNTYQVFSYTPEDLENRSPINSTHEDNLPLGLYEILWSNSGEYIAVLYNDFSKIEVIDLSGNLVKSIPYSDGTCELLSWSANDADIYYAFNSEKPLEGKPIVKAINIQNETSTSTKVQLFQNKFDYSYEFYSGQIGVNEYIVYSYRGFSRYYVHFANLTMDEVLFVISNDQLPYDLYLSSNNNIVLFVHDDEYWMFDLQTESMSSLGISSEFILLGWDEETDTYIFVEPSTNSIIEYYLDY